MTYTLAILLLAGVIGTVLILAIAVAVWILASTTLSD